MAVIGKFQHSSPEEFSGFIRTLTIDAKVKIAPMSFEADDNRPNYRVMTAVGGHEIGAGWIKRSQSDDSSYISVQIDDPSFPEPIRAILKERDGTFDLIWTRQKVSRT
jgi:uncharacterized protein (DUF736 family)